MLTNVMLVNHSRKKLYTFFSTMLQHTKLVIDINLFCMWCQYQWLLMF